MQNKRIWVPWGAAFGPPWPERKTWFHRKQVVKNEKKMETSVFVYIYRQPFKNKCKKFLYDLIFFSVLGGGGISWPQKTVFRTNFE